MRIAVTSNGPDLDAHASPVFGRCPWYVFVETEDMTYQSVENPATVAASGAGIQAAQFVVQQGAEAVVTGNVGPNAFSVFQAARVTIYPFQQGTVREAAEAFRTGRLQSIADATAQAGAGMGSPGTGFPDAGQAGMGYGRGMGMGMGRGMGRGRWMQAGPTGPAPQYGGPSPMQTPSWSQSTGAEPSREDEIRQLRETAQQLQEQLKAVTARLDELQGDV